VIMGLSRGSGLAVLRGPSTAAVTMASGQQQTAAGGRPDGRPPAACLRPAVTVAGRATARLGRPAPPASLASPADGIRVTPGRVGRQGRRGNGTPATATATATAATATAAAAATAGGSKRRADGVDRVRSCGDDEPRRERDGGAGRVGVCTRLAWDTALCRGLGLTLHDARERGHGGSVEEQSPSQADLGHRAVAPHRGQRHDCARQGVRFGRIRRNEAADGLVAAAGRLDARTRLDRAGQDVVGADAAGGVGPGMGGDGDRAAPVRPSRGGCPRWGGTGRGDEQTAAGRHDGHCCSGQCLPQT
jgi:hypothetical protein